MKSTVISSFARFILGGGIFTQIRAIVLVYNDSTLSGLEKRAAAVADIERLGLEIAGWAINLGIELAVAWAKSQSKE